MINSKPCKIDLRAQRNSEVHVWNGENWWTTVLDFSTTGLNYIDRVPDNLEIPIVIPEFSTQVLNL